MIMRISVYKLRSMVRGALNEIVGSTQTPNEKYARSELGQGLGAAVVSDDFIEDDDEDELDLKPIDMSDIQGVTSEPKELGLSLSADDLRKMSDSDYRELLKRLGLETEKEVRPTGLRKPRPR